jgi:hypothetical protein
MNKSRTLIYLAVLLTHVTLSGTEGANAQQPQRKFKHNGNVTSRYDPAKDKTTVFMQPYVVKESTNYVTVGVARIAITAGFTYSGKKLESVPQTIEFGILSESTSGYLYEKDRKLIVTIDGETIDLGEMTLITSRFFRLEGDKWREDLAITLPYDVFAKFTNAKKVEIKAGTQKFTLRKEHLEALRDLASRTVS